MKKIKNLILLSFLAIICAGCRSNCENGYRYITFVNKSGKKIGYQLAIDDIANISQDTFFYCNKTSDNFIPKDSIFVLESSDLYCGWEDILADEYYLQFLVLDNEKFRKSYAAPCDSVRKYVPIIGCYRLTPEDLHRMNWTVVYPPEKQNNIEP